MGYKVTSRAMRRVIGDGGPSHNPAFQPVALIPVPPQNSSTDRGGRMRRHPTPVRSIALACLAAGLLLSGCGSISLPSLGTSSEPPPPMEAPPSAAMPSRYAPEEIIGRWGLASYHRPADRPRTEAQARGQCRNP